MPIDLRTVAAIDVHTHVHASVADGRRAGDEAFHAMAGYFGNDGMRGWDVPGLAQYYRERRMAAVTFTVDTVTRTGNEPRPSNEEVLEQCRAHDDVLVPFVSVDPGRPDALEVARKLIDLGGVRGFKFHPNTQEFAPNDRSVYPLYELLQSHDMIALFHTGQTGVGAGTSGGGGIRLRWSNPMLVDDVAADFPSLRIILAHPSFPWQDEAIAVALHKPTVHIDLSGWSPKYFPPQLVQYANTLLRERVLFGSDFPAITPDRWMDDLEKTAIRDEVKPLLMKDNAARLLGLDDGAA